MDNRIEELRKEGNEEVIAYLNHVKSSVENKSYFREALSWYFFRYISPICDRTYLIFGAIASATILFYLFQMYNSAYPLVQKVPIFIKANADAEYFPYIYPLKIAVNKNNSERNFTADDIVAQYLVKKYVETRESYDFSKSNIAEINDKFTQIKNTSTTDEYRIFQMFMSKDNPNSPIQNFSKNISRTITVESVSIVRQTPNYSINTAKEFIIARIPEEAQVHFIATTKIIDETGSHETKEKFYVKIRFDFAGINREKRDAIKFTVKSYRLFKRF